MQEFTVRLRIFMELRFPSTMNMSEVNTIYVSWELIPWATITGSGNFTARNVTERHDVFHANHTDEFDLGAGASPDLFPFESYRLNVAIDIGWQGFDGNNTEVDVRLYRRVNVLFRQGNVSGNISGSRVSWLIELTRLPESVWLMVAVPLACSFMLGATLMVEKLSERLTVYLAVFVILITFAGMVAPSVPLKLSAPLLQRWLVALTISSAIFTVASLSGHLFEGSRLWLDFAGVVGAWATTAWLFLDLTLPHSPVFWTGLIYVGLLFGWAARFVERLLGKR